MCFESAAPRQLARSGATLGVYQLGDDNICVDLGPSSIVLSYIAFDRFSQIVETALQRVDNGVNGVLAGDGIHGAIWRCDTHGTLTLMIDRVALRLGSTMLPALHTLCQTACQALWADVLPGERSLEPMSYLLN